VRVCDHLQDLEERGKLPDAAVAFLACHQEADALRCYQYAGDADMAFALLLRSSPPPSSADVRRLALSLIETLQAVGRSDEAGAVAATYLKDASTAVQCYVAAGHWRAALNAASQGGDPRLMANVLAPAVAVAAESQLADIRGDTERMAKYWQRLLRLRDKRLALAATVGA
jgi:hypothetical protein